MLASSGDFVKQETWEEVIAVAALAAQGCTELADAVGRQAVTGLVACRGRRAASRRGQGNRPGIIDASHFSEEDAGRDEAFGPAWRAEPVARAEHEAERVRGARSLRTRFN